MHEKLNSMRRELTEILRSDRLLKSAVREVNKMDMIKGSLIIRNSRHVQDTARRDKGHRDGHRDI